MSLSCTISEILAIISQNLKRSCDSDHAHLRDYLKANTSDGQPVYKIKSLYSLSRSRDLVG